VTTIDPCFFSSCYFADLMRRAAVTARVIRGVQSVHSKKAPDAGRHGQQIDELPMGLCSEAYEPPHTSGGRAGRQPFEGWSLPSLIT
jgi:hypothetical protein